jgi:hypothetical protein
MLHIIADDLGVLAVIEVVIGQDKKQCAGRHRGNDFDHDVNPTTGH